MLTPRRDVAGMTDTLTSLRFVPVRLTLTTRLLAPPAMLTVAPQKFAVPTHRTVCVRAAPSKS